MRTKLTELSMQKRKGDTEAPPFVLQPVWSSGGIVVLF
jgi:hypothetical protein